MLVLTRKPNESVYIADNIEVVVLGVKHGKVRLGFRCPDDVKVIRNEIYTPPKKLIETADEASAAKHCFAG